MDACWRAVRLWWWARMGFDREDHTGELRTEPALAARASGRHKRRGVRGGRTPSPTRSWHRN
eukprot:6917467-Prymnesium_polylepis.1